MTPNNPSDPDRQEPVAPNYNQDNAYRPELPEPQTPSFEATAQPVSAQPESYGESTTPASAIKPTNGSASEQTSDSTTKSTSESISDSTTEPLNPSTDFGQSPAASFSGGVMSDYSSNPFMAAARGLGKALTVNPISSLTIGFIWIAAFVLLTIIGTVLGVVLPDEVTIVPIILLIVGFWYIIAKGIGAATVVHIKSHEDETVTGRQAFGSLSSKGIWRLIGALFVGGLAVIAGLILLIIPGLIIGSRLALAPFAIYNENLGVMASLKRSWSLTRGHTWEMLGAGFAAMLINGSGGFLSAIAGQSSYANRYFELAEAEKAQQSTGKMHWLNPGVIILTIIGMALYFGLLFALPTSSMNGSKASNGTYCYYTEGSGQSSFERDCVDKQECLENEMCALTYPNITSQNSPDNRNSPLFTN